MEYLLSFTIKRKKNFFRQSEFQSLVAWLRKIIGNSQDGKRYHASVYVCLWCFLHRFSKGRWNRGIMTLYQGGVIFCICTTLSTVMIIVTVSVTTTINLVLAPATIEDSPPWMWSCKCLGRHQLPAPACSSTAHPTGSLASPVPGFPLQANSCQTACYWLEKVGEILKSIWWSFNTLRFDQFQQAHRMIG